MSSLFGRSRKINRQIFGPAIESLEPRAYFSSGTPVLMVTVPGPIPPSAISGEKFKDRIGVNVANNGTGKASGPYTFTFFASADANLGVTDSQVYQVKHGLGIGVQKNKTIFFHIPTLPVNLNGSYFILAQVNSIQATGIGASSSKIAITPAHIDLSNAVTKVPSIGRLGHKISVTLVVSNLGNVEASKKLLAVAFSASSLASGASALPLATVSTHIALKANSSKILHLKVPIPLGTLSGNQFIVAKLDPLDVFSDTTPSNNLAVSATPVSLR